MSAASADEGRKSIKCPSCRRMIPVPASKERTIRLHCGVCGANLQFQNPIYPEAVGLDYLQIPLRPVQAGRIILLLLSGLFVYVLLIASSLGIIHVKGVYYSLLTLASIVTVAMLLIFYLLFLPAYIAISNEDIYIHYHSSRVRKYSFADVEQATIAGSRKIVRMTMTGGERLDFCYYTEAQGRELVRLFKTRITVLP